MPSSSKGSHPRPAEVVAPHQPKKRAHRASRACDFCHSRSIRCRPSENDKGPCQSCVEYGRDCTYNRPLKKRGVKSSHCSTNASSAGLASTNSEPVTPIDPKELIDQTTLFNLAEVYFETVYPTFPFFHKQTLLQKIEAQDYLRDPSYLAVMISLSALSVARIRDGAFYSNQWDSVAQDALPNSEMLVSVAHDVIPKDSRASENLDYLRCFGLLALTGIQNAKSKEVHFWLGIYSTILRYDGLQNEGSWPKGISKIEVEERRRLFWSMYSLEIFSAACFDTPMYCREQHNNVLYPEEIDDDVLAEGDHQGQLSWLRGWNFVIDLYRILEHAIDQHRTQQGFRSRMLTTDMFRSQHLGSAAVISETMRQYERLPRPFKEVKGLSLRQKDDIYGFQAVNITLTFQLTRMILFSLDAASVEERCSIVEIIIHTFTQVPIGYLKAMSTPLIIHLGAIGRFLSSMLDQPLPATCFGMARTSLKALAELLANLGQGTLVGSDPSKSIVNQIEHMETAWKSHRPVPTPTATFAQTRIPRSLQQRPPTSQQPSVSQFPTPPPSSFRTHRKEGLLDLSRMGTTIIGPPSADSSLPTQSDNSQLDISPQMYEDWSWAFDFAQHDDRERKE